MDHICSNQNRQSDSEKTRTIGRVGKKKPKHNQFLQNTSNVAYEENRSKRRVGSKNQENGVIGKGKRFFIKKKGIV